MDRESKPSSSGRSDASGAVAALAERWIARREAGLDASERFELRTWLAAPEHAAAFASADSGRTELDWPLHTGSLDAVLDELDCRARKRRSRRRTMGSAAALAVVVLAIGWSLRPGTDDTMATTVNSSALIVSQPQRQTLSDGSV